MPLTEPQAKALKIIQEQGPIHPREFARAMWPDNPNWIRVSRCGPYGSSRGGGMNLAGGGYLGKLRKRGWIEQHWSQVGNEVYNAGYVLTQEGRKALSEAEK